MKVRLILLVALALALTAAGAAPASAQSTCDPNQQPICVSGLERLDPYTKPIYDLLGELTVPGIVQTALKPRTACVTQLGDPPICVTVSGYGAISEYDQGFCSSPDPSDEYYRVAFIAHSIWDYLTDCSTTP